MNNKIINSEHEQKKYNTALAALNAPEPSIATIKRDRGEKILFIEITNILQKLFSARYSKQQLNPVLVDEFSAWVSHKDNYYFLKLPEIELALMDYRGQVFQVIDLEALKTMIEDFDMKRCQAVEKTRPEPEQSKESAPMPEKTKQLWNEMLIKRALKEQTYSRRPKDLIELFTIQKKANPEAEAEIYYNEWKEQYKKRAALAKESGIEIESEEQFVKNRESYFIYSSKIRIHDGQ